MNRKGVGSEESAIERKDDESPFFFSSFLVLNLCWKGLHGHVWNRMEQAFLDGYSSILDSV
jgi:hypothetical protein